MAKKKILPKKELKLETHALGKKESAPSFLDKYFVPQNIFLFLGLWFGIVFIVTIPPFQVPDESVHFKRVYKLSTFDVFQTETKGSVIGDYMPSNLDSTPNNFSYLAFRPYNKTSRKAILDNFKYKFNYDNQAFLFNSASNYSFFSYIPQLPVMFILRQFDISILTVYYLGKIFSLFFYIICIYYSIKIIPFGKNIMLVLALLPNAIQIAGSFSSDNCSNVLTFLAVAIILSLTQSTNIFFSWKKLWLYIFISVVIGVIKPIYFPIAFLGLIIPVSNFSKNQYFWIFNFICIFSCIFFTGIWTYLIINLNVTPPGFVELNIDPSKQVSNILNNPLSVLLVAKNTFTYFWGFYWQSSVGVLGYLDTVLKPWVYNIFYILLFSVALLDFNKTQKIRLVGSIFLTLIGFAIIFGAFLGIYIYSKIDALVVEGIQGRYFMPGLICVFVAIPTYFKFTFEPLKLKFILFFLSILLFAALNSTQSVLFSRFYR